MAFKGLPRYGVNILFIGDENNVHIGCVLFLGFGNRKLLLEMRGVQKEKK